jgi:MFS family permease
MKSTHALPAKALEANIRRFILFRLFFNARFYYPVFTVLFLDYGLTLEQFAILNVVWAITIVIAEVPSGALADIFGRKRLLVFASILMFVEMSLLVIVPIGTSSLLFMVFLANRILSGLAEAAASGADEALAYDSLKLLGREKDWPQVLEKMTRVVSVGFFVTMITGAIVYDHDLLNRAISYLGETWEISENLSIRLPIILCLMTSCIVIFATLGMQELHDGKEPDEKDGLNSKWTKLAGPFKQVFAAGRWTLDHRFVLFVIIAALAIDSVARQFVVLASEYYRIIEIPTGLFGVIGACMSLLGLINARISRYMVAHYSPFINFLLLSALLLFGLSGIALAVPYLGILFAIFAFSMMGMVAFQSSYYINREVGSAHRATVLSFRGLALNLGLGFASLLYTALIASLKATSDSGLSPDAQQIAVFKDSLKAFPLYFVVLALLVVILGKVFIRRSHLCFSVTEEKQQD